MFDSAKQKIDRADYHIADLERQFEAFVAEKPHRFVVQTDANGRLTIGVRFVKEPPSVLALIIGDAFHNLRCALDHVVWELVGRDKGTQDRHLKFPTGDNRVNFEAACNGIKTPGQWVKDTVRATEAFADGKGGELYNLHLLDNADKHTVISPILRATSFPKFSIISPTGQTFMTMEGNIVIGGADNFANIAQVPAGHRVELDDDAKCPPSIFSHKPNGRYAPTFALVKRIREAVVETIAEIEGKVPT